MKSAQNLFTKIDRLEDNDLIDFISELGDFIKSKIGKIYSDEHLIGSIYKDTTR